MNKRLTLLLLVFSILICWANKGTVFAHSKGEGKPPKSLCIEEFNKRSKEFDNRVLKDIVKSYNLNLSGYKEFTYSDLDLKVGDNLYDHSDKISLQHLFVGESLGSRRLFLENGLGGSKGYFLYKRTDGNNVKKELHKMGKIWVVFLEDEKKAKKFQFKPFNWDKCSEN